MPRSKPFVIATEGATTDGRKISAEWINQMAETYDPKAFTALGNLEHYLSPMPDSPFSPYGKVLELSTREAQIMGQKKLQLTAIFDANDGIVALQKSGKKMFCSIEINPNFADSGKAYLQGLAFTDNPASLGTEIMEFAAKMSATASPFTSRKKSADNLFSAAEEVTLELEPDAPPTASGDTLFTKIKELLSFGKKDADARFADIGQAVETVALSQKDLLEKFAALEKANLVFADSTKATADDLEASRKEYAALLEKLGHTSDGSQKRPAAKGGDGNITTDC